MTLEELQAMGANHERELELIRESLSQLLRVAASYERQLGLIRDALHTQGELNQTLLEGHAQAVQKHDSEMAELRAIVAEIGEMLQNFLASLKGETRNGGA